MGMQTPGGNVAGRPTSDSNVPSSFWFVDCPTDLSCPVTRLAISLGHGNDEGGGWTLTITLSTIPSSERNRSWTSEVDGHRTGMRIPDAPALYHTSLSYSSSLMFTDSSAIVLFVNAQQNTFDLRLHHTVGGVGDPPLQLIDH